MFDRAKSVAAQVKQAGKPDQHEKKSALPHMTLTIDEVAEELNISKKSAYRLVQTPGFPSFFIGQRVVVDRQGLIEWVRQQWNKNKKPVQNS